MINQSFLEIIIYANFACRILTILAVFALIIIVGAITLQKKLEPDCKKDFSILFLIYLVILMFSLFIDLFLFESNKSLINLLLCFSMEIYLFHKKSKWKFAKIASVLLSISIILRITSIFILFFPLDYFVISVINVVIAILISFNYIILGNAILKLLSQTGHDNSSIVIYTKPISIGIIFIFYIKSLITPFLAIGSVIYLFTDNNNLYLWIMYLVPILLYLVLIIGLINLAKGAIKTMFVPLIFSKDKGAKGFVPEPEKRIQLNSIIYCPECGVPFHSDMQFCANCGTPKNFLND